MPRILHHPDVPLSRWQAFRESSFSMAIKEVIDRDKIGMQPGFVPLARGVAVASNHLLQRAGYDPNTCRLSGFDIEFDFGFTCLSAYKVGRYRGKNLWAVVRGSRGWPIQRILVHQFGSTPVVARHHKAAMQLAIHYHKHRLRH